jgi:hypothetical protein
MFCFIFCGMFLLVFVVNGRNRWIARDISIPRVGLADRLMGVSGEILVFLFLQGRVRRWKIGDVWGRRGCREHMRSLS